MGATPHARMEAYELPAKAEDHSVSSLIFKLSPCAYFSCPVYGNLKWRLPLYPQEFWDIDQNLFSVLFCFWYIVIKRFRYGTLITLPKQSVIWGMLCSILPAQSHVYVFVHAPLATLPLQRYYVNTRKGFESWSQYRQLPERRGTGIAKLSRRT